jgi:hypothetical protein
MSIFDSYEEIKDIKEQYERRNKSAISRAEHILNSESQGHAR